MSKIIIGREAEKAILKERYSSEISEFIAITGRRRVGKTYLVNAYFENEMNFHFSGVLNASLSQQLQGFHYQYCAFFKTENTEKVPANWMEAFILLSRQLDKSRKKSKKVIFIDELPWLDTHKSNFLGALEWFWNNWAINKNVLLVVCGSATSWMINKIVNNKGGLHNRLTQRIHLLPFTLKESKDFLQFKKIKLSSYQIAQLYMVMGGIPHYLNEVKQGESSMQNIERICFQRDGLLVNEFENLYRALFKNSDNHLKIVFALAKKLKGLSRKELIKACKLRDGGAFSDILEELTWCNFITVANSYGKAKKDNIYRLTDEFSLFYLKFMYRKNNVNWLQLSSTSQWKSWAGYAFENLCFKHLIQIKKSLGIEGVYTEFYAFQSLGNKNTPGAQIDLLIDRNDGIINLCEIKFNDQKYVLTKSETQKIKHRIDVFKRTTKTQKTIFPTLIVALESIDNEYTTGFIQQKLSLENLIN
jgi:AAA+ ATPase superfamily predicted ATPase